MAASSGVWVNFLAGDPNPAGTRGASGMVPCDGNEKTGAGLDGTRPCAPRTEAIGAVDAPASGGMGEFRDSFSSWPPSSSEGSVGVPVMLFCCTDCTMPLSEGIAEGVCSAGFDRELWVERVEPSVTGWGIEGSPDGTGGGGAVVPEGRRIRLLAWSAELGALAGGGGVIS